MKTDSSGLISPTVILILYLSVGCTIEKRVVVFPSFLRIKF